MCYILYLSTASSEDLGQLPHDAFIFQKPDVSDSVEALGLLRYPHKWLLLCRYGGCSCHFRHVADGSPEMAFAPPQDWAPEDADDIESTQAVYDLISELVKNGHKVDLVDIFSEVPPAGLKDLRVDIGGVPRDAFRFFENYRFDFVS